MAVKQAENRITTRKRVLLLCPYPEGSVPGQRFRYEQYLGHLRSQGLEIDIRPFLDESAMPTLYSRGRYLAKVLAVFRGFLRRLAILPSVSAYDFVFLYREAAPIGPPVLEWLLFRMGCKVIYDFDDAIYIAPRSSANPFMPYIRCAWKVDYITRKAHSVSVCNPHLSQWARERNHRVALIPTTIDEEYHRPPRIPKPAPGLPIVGWTGSHGTARYLEVVRPALVALQSRYDFEFRVICDHDPGFPELKNYRFIKWRLETEVEDLSEIQIGLMPVPEESWAFGKVGFKAIQYSGMGIPSVVSKTGSGTEVVMDGETGFAVNNDVASWTVALERLLADPALTRKLGENAREYILKNYSVRANSPKYSKLFEIAQ